VSDSSTRPRIPDTLTINPAPLPAPAMTLSSLDSLDGVSYPARPVRQSALVRLATAPDPQRS